MKAAVCRKFGPAENVRIEQVDKPVPKAGEVLVKVVASTVDIADVRVRALRVPSGFVFSNKIGDGAV